MNNNYYEGAVKMIVAQVLKVLASKSKPMVKLYSRQYTKINIYKTSGLFFLLSVLKIQNTSNSMLLLCIENSSVIIRAIN